ncbi:6-phosphogluconolactonase [Corynebacterium ciconiae DSM 44920]|uniref:6-phosphogluconolactonase n=1 Tax=Corynebacterium ciconiae TaxID=227319 RepID=UPI0003618B13|nr:6-phosphogluconolactonase [Corynebacterium ciconiae]WKD61248.1 6-phosphogluconolactonase [Corynebacterium ciconiae DSM 44920]
MESVVAIREFDTKEAVCTGAARDIAELIAETIDHRGVAHIVLTGGSVGIGTLAALKDHAVDWDKVHVYFGDERAVAVDHPDSNEGQAREALLDHVDIPEANIHGYGLGEKSLEAAAKDYASQLPATIDLHLLGMGHEGHINSLFPHSAATQATEASVLAVTDSPKPPAERVTLSLPQVQACRVVWLLVSGEEKAEAVSHVIHGGEPLDWPACGARGVEETAIYVSTDALSRSSV